MNVVDALVVSLSLDSTAFMKGQRDALVALTGTKKAAQKETGDIEKAFAKATKAAKETAEAGKTARDNFDQARDSVLSLAAAFLGARGIKEFVADITRSDAALGRLGVSLNTSPELISAWGAAAERMGGSASATAGSFQSLSDKIQRLQTAGEALPQAFYQIEAQGGRQIELNKGLGQTFTDLAADLAKIAETDPAKANFLGRQLGIDPDTVNLMIKNGARVGQVAAGLQRLAPTPAQIKAAQDMQEAWTALQQETASLAREIWTDLSPSLVPLLHYVTEIIAAIHDLIKGHEGWGAAITAVIAIWTGAKFFSFLSNVLALKNALLGVSEASAAFSGGGLLGFLAANPWIAGLIAAGAVLAPTEANGGEDERARHGRYSGGGGSGGDRASGGSSIPGRRGTGASRADVSAPAGSTALKNLIAQHEVGTIGPNGYNVVYNHGRDLAPPKPVTDMTIAEVLDYQRRGKAIAGSPAFPVGRAQFTRTTLAGLARRNNLDINTTKLTPELQEKFFDQLIAGRHGDVNGLRQEWDSLRGVNAAVIAAAARAPAVAPAATPASRSLASTIGTLPRIPVYSAAQSAALNNIANDNRATTTSSSNEMHIGSVNVNAPNATDAHGIAGHIDGALASTVFAQLANSGPN